MAGWRSARQESADKDSDKRQREAINAFAQRKHFEVKGEFYDAAVSGADAIETRPGFAAMLKQIAGNGARTIIVETASRFARDLIVQETGHRILKAQGIEIIAADSPTTFIDDGPTSRLVRTWPRRCSRAISDTFRSKTKNSSSAWSAYVMS